MIRVMCPHCQRRYRTMTEAMGKAAVCTGCRQTFRIGEARPPFEWKPTDLGEDSWIGVAPPAERPELKHCVFCDAAMPPGEVRCPACGANQITGVIHKTRPLQPGEVHVPWWARISLGWIMLACALAVLAAGTYGFVSSWLGRSAAEATGNIAERRLIQPALKYLREGGDEYGFPARFSGQVTDANLSRILELAFSPQPAESLAAILLIGCGRSHDVSEIVAAIDSEATASTARRIIEAIGARRLMELSNQPDPRHREAAARALCILMDLPRTEEILRQLTEPVTAERKTETLNRLCRFRPHAVGSFVVRVGDRRAPFTATVSQLGTIFYLQIGDREFTSSSLKLRTFEIPIEYWCAATGTAVDPVSVRQWISGMVRLSSPIGVGWQGKMNITTRALPPAPLPGFLPVDLPEPGQTTEVPVTLADK